MAENVENQEEKQRVKGRFQAVAEIDEPEVIEKKEVKPMRLGKFQAVVQVSEDEDEEKPEIEETKVFVRRPIFTATVEQDEEEEEVVPQFKVHVHQDSKREESPEDSVELSDLRLQQLKEAFFMFDFNQDGIIDKQDLKLTLGALGQEAEPEEIDKMMEEATEPLDFDAFVNLMALKKINLDPEDILQEALSKWDINNSGLISENQIKQDLMTWGDKFTKQEVEIAFEEAPIVEPGEMPVTEPMIDYLTFCSRLCSLQKDKRKQSE